MGLFIREGWYSRRTAIYRGLGVRTLTTRSPSYHLAVHTIDFDSARLSYRTYKIASGFTKKMKMTNQ